MLTCITRGIRIALVEPDEVSLAEHDIDAVALAREDACGRPDHRQQRRCAGVGHNYGCLD